MTKKTLIRSFLVLKIFKGLNLSQIGSQSGHACIFMSFTISGFPTSMATISTVLQHQSCTQLQKSTSGENKSGNSIN